MPLKQDGSFEYQNSTDIVQKTDNTKEKTIFEKPETSPMKDLNIQTNRYRQQVFGMWRSWSWLELAQND